MPLGYSAHREVRKNKISFPKGDIFKHGAVLLAKKILSLHQSPTQCRPLLCLNQNQCLLLLLSPQNCHVSYKMSCFTNAETHISTSYKGRKIVIFGMDLFPKFNLTFKRELKRCCPKPLKVYKLKNIFMVKVEWSNRFSCWYIFWETKVLTIPIIPTPMSFSLGPIFSFLCINLRIILPFQWN